MKPRAIDEGARKIGCFDKIATTMIKTDSFTAHAAYILGLTTLALLIPRIMWDPEAAECIFIIGLVATWRYSWATLHWMRFLTYKHVVFPRWRKSANTLGEAALPPHVYLLVTSFRIGSETTRRVYASVFREAIHYGHPVTIVVSIVERADQMLIKQLFALFDPPEHIKLVFVRIGGTGKRDALACGFRAISRQSPPPGSVTAVVDGDSMLSDGLIAKCAPFFTMFPNLGALTTDENCEVEGNWLFREWYTVRFAQRNIYMSSVSLSRRVLTLTGRMSMFRTDIIVDPEFIERVELDWIDHWRLGRFKFLTGDDKSSWYHLLSHGYEMLYIPDVDVITIETPPDPSFVKSSVVLMRRWFGNMLRTNERAIRLGPKIMGWFPWISIIDQRISMWTSLTGPVLAILATIAVTPFALVYYILWIGITRYIITISLLASRPRVSALYPFFLYYNQLVGSLVKTVILFRLDKQKWTRQNTTLSAQRSSLSERLINFGSSYVHAFSIVLFVTVLAAGSGMLRLPDFVFWYNLIKY